MVAYGRVCMFVRDRVLLWHLSLGTDGTPSRIRQGPGRTAGVVTRVPAWTLSSGLAPLHCTDDSATASTRCLFSEIFRSGHWRQVCSWHSWPMGSPGVTSAIPLSSRTRAPLNLCCPLPRWALVVTKQNTCWRRTKSQTEMKAVKQ